MIDSHGGVSEEAFVQIDIKPSVRPQAAQLDTILMDEESNSPSFLLYGN